VREVALDQDVRALGVPLVDDVEVGDEAVALGVAPRVEPRVAHDVVQVDDVEVGFESL